MADEHGAFAQFSRQLLPRRFIDIAECDLGAFTKKQLHHLQTHTAGTTSDQRHLALQTICHLRLLLFFQALSRALLLPHKKGGASAS